MMDSMQIGDDLVAQLTQGKAVSPKMLKKYRQSVNRAIDEGRKAPKGRGIQSLEDI